MTYAFDPELAAAVGGLPSPDFTDLEATRAATSAMIVARSAAVDRTGLSVRVAHAPSLTGDGHAVPLRLHEPLAPASGPRPAIVEAHGGGFCFGDARMSDGRAADLARRLDAVVIGVDYRLAPEHPYPTLLEDCYAALAWVAGEAEALGVDPRRIALAGHSAGAGLCAGLALLARDRGGPHVAFQYLGSPEIDDRLETPSMVAYVDTPLWNRANAVLSWRHYLGPLWGADDVPIHAAPARANVQDLVGLPPAYISTTQFDPLRDEALAYGAALAQAGVPTELHLFPGAFHGSFMIGSAGVSRRETDEQVEVLGRALRAP